jgi:RNA polymerase sigma-70 factor (ECF subfamily)
MKSEIHTRARQADDEGSIIRRIVAGDRSAFEMLMRQYNQRLYRLARATLGDATEAEDAVQDAYLAAYRAMPQFRGDAAVSTWLSRLVLNECFTRLRRNSRRQNVIPLAHSTPEIESEMDNVAAREEELPEQTLGRAQVRALLESKLDELPESHRVVFVLRSVEELSVEETAACLEIPEATVRSRHFRAKGMLRESLARDLDVAERDLFEFRGSHCDRIVARVLERLGANSSDESST